MSLSNYLDRKEVRDALIKQFTVAHLQNWQQVGTPEAVVKGMLGLVPRVAGLQYVVLFNLEFIEELVFSMGVPREDIMFMSDSPEEGDVCMGVYGVRTFVLPQIVRDPAKVIAAVAVKISKAFYQGGTMPKTNNLVVIGNPPYNSPKVAGSTSSNNIYHLFVQAVVTVLQPKYHSFIIPSRWMLGGKGLDKFRSWMLNGAPMDASDKCRHFSEIVDFKSSTQVFNADIAGGVCYYLWDRDTNSPMFMYSGKPRKLDEFDVLVRDNIGVDILHKVLYHHKGKFMDSIVSARKPYGFDADTTPLNAGVPCWFKQSIGKKFGDPAIVKDPRKDLGNWKVLAPRASVDHAGGSDCSKMFVPSSLKIAAPGEACTETYLVLNSFSSQVEATNFTAYVLTKFFRFMLALRAVSQDLPSDRYAWIPDLGTYITAPTDAQLVAKFGLTQDEINYINKRII